MNTMLKFSDKSKAKQYFADPEDFADAAHRWLDAGYQPVAWHTYTKSDGKQETKPFQWKKKILSITHEDVPIFFWFLSRMYARSVRQIGLLASSNRKWPGVFDAPQG